MSNFYLSDPLVLNELRLQDDDFRIYQHCCRQFNVKTFTVFIRLVDIAGQFQISVEQVQLSLARMTRIRIGGEPLIKIKDIYQSMEEIADKCQTVANNFETIIMKNS